MAFVGSGPVVEQLNEQFWRVAAPLVYEGETQEFVIPEGFRTDFASVPRAVAWLIPRYGIYTCAAILHHFLLSSHAVRVADADGIFRRALREADVSVPRRWMMWAAVRFASRLRGAAPADITLFTIIAVVSIAFLAIPVIVVQSYLVLFWFIELVSWAIVRLTHRASEPAPPPEMTTA